MGIEIKTNISLKPYNTFGINARASYFTVFNTLDELTQVVGLEIFKNNKRLVLGGGSNILLTKDFDGIVLKNDIKGIGKIKEDESYVFVKTGAGEVWHDFVMYAIRNNYAGVENLSLIPGTVGAAPMQNIGAYGVELKEVFDSLEAVETDSGKVKTFFNADCKFGYRESIFKNSHKDKYIITSVIFRLLKTPNLNITYGAIQQILLKNSVTEPTIKDVSDAVIEIRKSKLPDPAVLGNSGSFFKNPEIAVTQLEELKKLYPSIPGYPVATPGMVKLAAGWLIEQCGWKGKRVGETGAHKDQALVLVNYGNATGEEILNLSLEIKKSVWEKFGVEIIPEVNVL